MNLSVWYKLSDQTRYALYISGIGALITVVANYFLIPRYSYAGAAFVTFLAYASMVILSYIWGQKNYPIPYKVGKMLIYMLIGAGITYLSNFVFDRNLIIGNALFAVFLAGIFIAERKKIRAVLKR